MIKPLTTMRETRVQPLGWEDPLEKEMATHTSTLAWKIPWTEERDGLQSMGSQKLDTTERLHFLSFIEKDREAWHAAVHGVTKSHTQLSN